MPKLQMANSFAISRKRIEIMDCDIKGCPEKAVVAHGKLHFCKSHGEELGFLVKAPDFKTRTVFVG